MRIDGVLSEAVYELVEPMSDFIQNDPAEGEPATERTEVWLLFDDDNVYVVARCWETRPDRIIASEMRRDNIRIVRDDNFAWSLDTFYDRRNVVLFEVSAGGRPARRAAHQRVAAEPRLEPRVRRVGRPHGGRLGYGGGPALQVVALPRRGSADLGLPGAARQPLEERVVPT